MRRRLLVTLGALIAVAAIAAPVAWAAPPYHGSFDIAQGPFEATDLCSFPVTISSHIWGDYTDFYDTNGILVREQNQVAEQDVFIANGTTLVGDAFRYNVTVGFDSGGNVTAAIETGGVERVTLPDGSVFWSAGRIDLYNRPPGWVFIATPDTGHSGDVDAFCAALS